MTLRGGISLDDYVKSLPWRFKVRLWFARRKMRKALRDGWRPTVHACCCQCLHPIYEQDDDACVCTNCGGNNRRLSPKPSGQQKD